MAAKFQGRSVSIDILRGIAIIGMILCAQIGWNSNLPAWMFHCQVPPPDYVFNPEVRGITWVDLVFPFFLFSMGAAFPFALGRRLDSGKSVFGTVLMLLRRWGILIVFSIILGNAYRFGASEASSLYVNILKIVLWGGLFMSLLKTGRISDKMCRVINASGAVILAVVAILAKFILGATLSHVYSDIIIMVLAYVCFFGGLIWIVTRNSVPGRWSIFAVVVILKGISSYIPGVFDGVNAWCGSHVGWIFSFKFLQYLAVVIPGTVVGDIILKDGKRNSSVNLADKNGGNVIAAILGGVIVVFQLWALFTRHVITDLAVTSAVGLIVFLLLCKNRETWADIMRIGFFLLVSGIIFDPIDGGIRKDDCNLSYMLVTSGMAAVCISIFTYIEDVWGLKSKWISACGQNPMIAYTFTNFITVPVFGLVGLLPVLDASTVGSPFMGLMRGIIMTSIMFMVTVFFTRKKIFWKS